MEGTEPAEFDLDDEAGAALFIAIFLVFLIALAANEEFQLLQLAAYKDGNKIGAPFLPRRFGRHAPHITEVLAKTVKQVAAGTLENAHGFFTHPTPDIAGQYRGEEEQHACGDGTAALRQHLLRQCPGRGGIVGLKRCDRGPQCLPMLGH